MAKTQKEQAVTPEVTTEQVETTVETSNETVTTEQVETTVETLEDTPVAVNQFSIQEAKAGVSYTLPNGTLVTHN